MQILDILERCKLFTYNDKVNKKLCNIIKGSNKDFKIIDNKLQYKNSTIELREDNLSCINVINFIYNTFTKTIDKTIEKESNDRIIIDIVNELHDLDNNSKLELYGALELRAFCGKLTL